MKTTSIIKLKRGLVTTISKATNFSAAYISDIFSGKVRVDSYSTSKKLAGATGTYPMLFLEGSQEEIVTTVNKTMSVS